MNMLKDKKKNEKASPKKAIGIGAVLILIVSISVVVMSFYVYSLVRVYFIKSNIVPDRDICSTLRDGADFKSIKKYPGEKLIIPLFNREVTFETDGTYSWLVSDFIDLGEYTCANNVIDVKNYSYRKINANYDLETGILTWDNEEYYRVKSNSDDY